MCEENYMKHLDCMCFCARRAEHQHVDGLSLAGSAGEAAEPGHQETGGQQEGAARIQAGQCFCRG